MLKRNINNQDKEKIKSEDMSELVKAPLMSSQQNNSM